VTEKFVEGAPDVVFEVVSPTDRRSKVEQKVRDWLNGGATAVVIIEPKTKVVRVHRASSTATVDDAITLDDVIPGWRLPLAQLFA
jgi:Uma2 family endonuclease